MANSDIPFNAQLLFYRPLLDSPWSQLFSDVWNLALWYFLLLTLDFAWLWNLSNLFQVFNFGICMTWSFQSSTTLDFYFFHFKLRFCTKVSIFKIPPILRTLNSIWIFNFYNFTFVKEELVKLLRTLKVYIMDLRFSITYEIYIILI